jgi:hypothetical protein
MKLDFSQKAYFVMAVFMSVFAALLLPLTYIKEKAVILLPVAIIFIFSLALYKTLPGEKK